MMVNAAHVWGTVSPLVVFRNNTLVGSIDEVVETSLSLSLSLSLSVSLSIDNLSSYLSKFQFWVTCQFRISYF